MSELEQLRAEVAALKEQLQPYLDQEAENIRQQAWQERLELLVDLCVPRYDSRSSNKPVRHPETEWWWNGASIIDYDHHANGDIDVDLKSYVAGGNYDEKRITLLAEWFVLDDPTQAVREWCIAESARREEKKKQIERQQALAEIERLQRKLGEQ